MNAHTPAPELEPAEAPLGASAWEEPALPSRPAALAVLAAALGAAAGGVAWAAVSRFFHGEIGWLAWGIGVLVGGVTVAVGGRGQGMAVLGAALALSGILAGKALAVHWDLESFLDESLSEEIYADYDRAAQAFAQLSPDPSDEEVRAFMVAHHFTEAAAPAAIRPAELAWFRQMQEPFLREFATDPPSYETWRAQCRSEWMGASSLLNFVVTELDGFDLLFAFLGIATAFRIIQGRKPVAA